ncbi:MULTISPECIES: CBS domain-containing protein [unclassified Streptomyces]|uniref:CBS domain-containing protein n=1 Tax=unclassified Streptomyces TaxID=2593676 RepID=UPI000A6E86BA|nr:MULTISPECIES: CBS domain-containing protein [unclassified Streptomyces]MCX5151650.1 CBS domain-containing protein [Streptomyces sp. NBC_00320]WSN53116.1 CBS domain-containing protein [Streptomyces sp. NBC_01296]WSW57375.1 CBS domain-containing protein [Streptomyces sp. NBC_00998]
MKHIKVGDLMTDEVVAVVSATSFKDVAKLLAQHDVSGLPVVDDEDRVVGVVSESDLLIRQAAPVAAESSEASPLAEVTAGEVMSTPAVTIHAEETAADAARLMTRRSVERLPVVDEEERLVGIVTRRDLLRLFLRPDSEIRRRVTDDVLGDTLGVHAEAVEVHVIDGVVTLSGVVDRQSQVPVLIRLVEQLEGVVAVASAVTGRVDDSSLAPRARTPQSMPW